MERVCHVANVTYNCRMALNVVIVAEMDVQGKQTKTDAVQRNCHRCLFMAKRILEIAGCHIQ